MSSEVTFYTVANDRFFPGAVALLNSLRVTGNAGQLVVVDFGLTESQRRALEDHALVTPVPAELAANPLLTKPFPYTLEPGGIVVLVDSDIVVTQPLDRIVSHADEGRIYVFRHDVESDRWFPEWEHLFALGAPPRRQPCVNSGFVAFSTEHWPRLLERWWHACRRIPPEETRGGGGSYAGPFWDGDQDALNAILMSEVPLEALLVERQHGSERLMDVRVTDEQTLACEHGGLPVTLLHYAGAPKPWEPKAWMRVRRNAYVRLLPRLLFAGDVPLPLSPAEVPFWLRQGPAPWLTLSALSAVNGGVRRMAGSAPRPVYETLRRVQSRLAG